MFRKPLLEILAGAWVCCYATLSWASTSLAQDVRAYDWESLALAGAAGLLGCAFRTLLTMAMLRSAVFRLPPEAWSDAVIAIIAGLAAYVVVQGASATIQAYWSAAGVPSALRLLIVVMAGWMGARFFGRLDRLGTITFDALGKRINGGDMPVADSPTPTPTPGQPGATP